MLKVWQLGFGRPHAPANLVIYADEATPGNVLRLDNRRKVLAVYVTLREFGPDLVKHADMWLPLAILRSSQIKDILGGASFCMRTLLRRIFITDKVTSEGVLLDLQLPQSRFVRLHLALGNFIGDGDAQRATWSAKGASGNLPCLMCKNVLSQHVPSPSPYLVHISCPDADRFDFCTNEDIWAKAEALRHQAGVATRVDFEELQRAMGMSFNPLGLLWDEELREHVKPVGCHTYVPMHALLSNGICQNESGLLLVACRDAGVPFSAFRDFR